MAETKLSGWVVVIQRPALGPSILDFSDEAAARRFVEHNTRAAILAVAPAESLRRLGEVEGAGVYVASRASDPRRPAMWQRLRASGVPITSTWIDEAGPGETADLGELWQRIRREVASSRALVLYVEADDFPLKGALIEVGMALALGKPVFVVAPGVVLEERSMRPLGSWARHPLVKFAPTVEEAARAALNAAEPGRG